MNPQCQRLFDCWIGFARVAIDLGPFGGAQSAGLELWLFALAYLVAVGAIAAAAFRRRDL